MAEPRPPRLGQADLEVTSWRAAHPFRPFLRDSSLPRRSPGHFVPGAKHENDGPHPEVGRRPVSKDEAYLRGALEIGPMTAASGHTI